MTTFTNAKDEGVFDDDFVFKEDLSEIFDKKYDSTRNTRPYLLASFGSAWGCMRVCCILKNPEKTHSLN